MRIWSVIGLVLMLQACSSKMPFPDPPKDLIPEDTMSMVIHDMVILEAGIQKRYQNVNRYYKTMIKSGDAYLESMHISRKRYERSYDYYVSRPEEFQRIYTRAMDSITVEINKLPPKPTSDSVIVLPPNN